MNRYIGADPSFTAYGLSVIDTKRLTITLDELKVDIDKHSPRSILDGISIVTHDVITRIFDVINLPGVNCRLSLELATTYGQMFQAELYALDYALYRNNNYIFSDVSLLSTTYLSWVKGKGYKPVIGKKEDTIFLVEKILDIFRDFGYTINICKTENTISSLEKVKNRYPRVKTITSGEADSFMFALQDFIKNETGPIITKILEECPRLMEEHELK